DQAGRATPAGTAAHRAVEDATDLAAARPWARLGHAATEGLAGLLGPRPTAPAGELILVAPGRIGVNAKDPGAAAPLSLRDHGTGAVAPSRWPGNRHSGSGAG